MATTALLTCSGQDLNHNADDARERCHPLEQLGLAAREEEIKLLTVTQAEAQVPATAMMMKMMKMKMQMIMKMIVM